MKFSLPSIIFDSANGHTMGGIRCVAHAGHEIFRARLLRVVFRAHPLTRYE